MKVVAVVVTYNNEDTVVARLTALNKQVNHIVVVDSASVDTTVERVKTLKYIELYRVLTNIGFTGGNNIGIEKALQHNPDYVFIVNPDVWLSTNCVKKLLFQAETHVQNRILGPVIYKDQKMQTIWSAGGTLDKKRYTAKLIGYDQKDIGQFVQTNQVGFVSGTCMLVPRQVLASGLRFYEPYFMYYEDVEFCVRAAIQGFSSYEVGEATIIHHENSSQVAYEMNKRFYLARNHLLFVERNAPKVQQF